MAVQTKSSGARQRATRRISLENFTLKDIPDIPTETVLECLKDDEYGDGALFAELFVGRCVYDHTDKVWYTWQGHYWKVDDVELMRHLVSGALASTYLKAEAEVNIWLAKLEASKGDKEAIAKRIEIYKARIKSLHARAYALKSVTRMRNVLTFASSFLATTAEKWDTLKWVLPTADGVIELRTGTLRPGKPEDYIRTIIPTRWKGLDAACPRFDRFLQEIFSYKSVNGNIAPMTEPERDTLISFLHRALGYAVTGLSVEHIFLTLLGDEGRNGKDTLMTVIRKVLGNMAGEISNDVLIAGGKFATPGAAKPHLVSLQGKRLAWASETAKGDRFDVGQVKFLTGGGNIPARQLYGKEYTFEPSHLLILLTNNKPHADAKDKAFWERVCPIEFAARYIDNPDPTKPYEQKPDKTLGNALEAEASGILAWFVRGCLAWQQVGLNIPPSVLKARAKYREEEDTLGLFISECCVVHAGCKVKSQVLYTNYVNWADANNIKPMSGTLFGVEISKAYRRKKGSDANYYEGIGLQAEYPTLAVEQAMREQEAETQDSSNGHHQEAVPVSVSSPDDDTMII